MNGHDSHTRADSVRTACGQRADSVRKTALPERTSITTHTRFKWRRASGEPSVARTIVCWACARALSSSRGGVHSTFCFNPRVATHAPVGRHVHARRGREANRRPCGCSHARPGRKRRRIRTILPQRSARRGSSRSHGAQREGIRQRSQKTHEELSDRCTPRATCL